jgi:DNA-binding CsgD family transcriptional regulator
MAGDVIGRRDELLAIEDFLRTARAGGQALLLEGDAGIGKTALWQEALRLAGERDFRVLRSRPTQSEAQVAFAALGDLLAPALTGVLNGLAPARRRALEIALLLREPEAHTLLPDTRVLGIAVISALRALATERPVLVAVDDSQWLDSSSAAVLAFALRRLDASPVAVLATVRGRPLEPPFELGRAFVTLRRLPVAPLSVGAVHRLLWGRLGIAVPRPVILRIHEISGGNPFFALELGRALVAGSIHAEYANVELPESLRAVVAQRLSALPARVRKTLAAVAALASPSVALLEALGGTSVEDVELAQRRGVVEFDGDRILFAHPLLAPACYEALPLHRRRRLHGRLAELDVELEERARHLAVAADGPDEEVAAALDAAAAHARGRGAAQAAADLAERAVSLTPPDASDAISLRRITAAEYCRYAGDMKKAASLLEEAVASAQPGRVRADALSRLAGARGMAEGFPAAVQLLRRALAEPGLGARQEVNILCELTWMAHVAGDNREAARHAEAGLVRARQLGEPATLAIALATVAQVTFARTGRIRHDLLDQSRELEQTLAPDRYASDQRWTWHVGLPMRLSPSRVTLALLLGRSGRHDESRTLWNALIGEATERADPDVVRCMFHRAQVEMTAGRWDTATQLCDEAIQLTRELGLEMFEPLCLSILAEIDAYRGETEKARDTIPDLLRVVETGRFRWQTYRLRIALAVLELSYDDAAASRRHAAQLLDEFEELDGYLAQLAGSAGIEALVATGELGRAEKLLALIDRRAAGGDTALAPLVLRCRGLVLAARGNLEGAIASLESAAASQINLFELARTLLALGNVQRRARHKRAARESLRRAAEGFEQLGARVWLEKTNSELRRIGGRTAPDGGLSETERQIVELVAAGRRNSEVAAELSLSPNTVAWNLSKVYRKLGVSSRTELAARMAGTAHE